MRTGILLSLFVLACLPMAARAQDATETKASSEGVAPKHEVQPPVLIKKVAPEYPKKARKNHVEGTVRLHAIIDKDGSVRDLEVLSGDPLLTDAAVKAVRQWRYEPVQLDGKSVAFDTTIEVVFALNKKS